MKKIFTLVTISVLFFQIEFLENRSVTLLVVRLEVLKVSTAVCNHLQKTTAAVKILRVFA